MAKSKAPNIKRIDINYYIPDMVQVFYYVENDGLNLPIVRHAMYQNFQRCIIANEQYMVMQQKLCTYNSQIDEGH